MPPTGPKRCAYCDDLGYVERIDADGCQFAWAPQAKQGPDVKPCPRCRGGGLAAGYETVVKMIRVRNDRLVEIMHAPDAEEERLEIHAWMKVLAVVRREIRMRM